MRDRQPASQGVSDDSQEARCRGEVSDESFDTSPDTSPRTPPRGRLAGGEVSDESFDTSPEAKVTRQ